MKEILGEAKTIKGLLGGTKFGIDFYQREYKWETKQVSELLDDLADKFLDSYEEGHVRSEVESYGHYFLGSIVISNKDGKKIIIDGQQRLTTLSLLLIYLHNVLANGEQTGPLADLIFSQRFGEKSFNIDVPERTSCMAALYSGEPFDDTDVQESIRNIVGRYADIEELFPDELKGAALPYFADWLIENVHLVEITAYSDDDAYTIFETMNDRGLSLSPTDMLKSYLLANITDTETRNAASNTWKERIRELTDLGKDEDADCIKAWLRSQHAKKIRERKRGSKPEDFGRIGTEFHRWVRDKRKLLGLNASGDFANFIVKEFDFYARQYMRLRQAASEIIEGLECVFYNAQSKFTLQFPVMLAPLRPGDSEDEIERKLGVVGAYLDILIARRIWNWRAIDYSTMQYAMFLLMRDIRGKSSAELAELLHARLDAEDEIFASNDVFYLTKMNGPQIHRMLARMIDYLETRSGMPSHYTDYVTRSGKHAHEIEHIWANHPERHEDDFDHPTDFAEYRNRIGGLLLLLKSFNASYGDLPYEKKRKLYYGQNILAQTLHDNCYEHSPGFLRFVEESGLAFKPHPQFKRADLDERQVLYQKLAELIWNPDRLKQAAAS